VKKRPRNKPVQHDEPIEPALLSIPLATYEQLAHELGVPGMIDVSRFKLGDACPRCSGHRVYAVDQDKNLWLCIANAMPVPWRKDQLQEHDATEYVDTEDFDRGNATTQDHR
jgi:hypothetical protein